MQTYQDDSGAWVAKLNGRVSGGHVTEQAAIAAIISVGIYALGSQDGDRNYTPPDIEIVRNWAIGVVNQQAGLERSKYGTNIPFQGDLYQLKEKEALGYNLDDTPSAEKYPILYAESAARNITPSALAQEYLFNATLFPKILAAIESERMRVNPTIKNAATIIEIEAALSTLDYESAVNAIMS